MQQDEPEGVVEGTGTKAEVATWSARQMVANNLRRAREARDVTQTELAGRLKEVTGAEWSRVMVSQAERGTATTRVRSFDANDILAFATALDVPVAWFFLPPVPGDLPGSDNQKVLITAGQKTEARRMGIEKVASLATAFDKVEYSVFFTRLSQEWPDHLATEEKVAVAKAEWLNIQGQVTRLYRTLELLGESR